MWHHGNTALLRTSAYCAMVESFTFARTRAADQVQRASVDATSGCPEEESAEGDGGGSTAIPCAVLVARIREIAGAEGKDSAPQTLEFDGAIVVTNVLGTTRHCIGQAEGSPPIALV